MTESGRLHGAGDDGWLAAYSGAVPVRLARRDTDGAVGVRIRSQQHTVDLDLHQVPAGEVLVVDNVESFGYRQTIRVRNARTRHELIVLAAIDAVVETPGLGTMRYGQADPSWQERAQAHSPIEVTVRGPVQRLIVHAGFTVDQDDRAYIRVLAGGRMTGTFGRGSSLQVDEGAVIDASYPALVILGDKTVRIRPGSDSKVGRLTFYESSSLRLQPSQPNRAARFAVDVVESEGGTIRLHDGLTIGLRQVVDRSLSSTTAELTITGADRFDAGVVDILADDIVSGLTVKGGVTTRLAPGAVLTRFTGNLRLDRCVDATVTAAPGTTFSYDGLVSEDPDRLRGATLRGLEIQDDANGRRHLRELRHANVIEPELSHLLVHEQGWTWRSPVAWPVRWPLQHRRQESDLELRSRDDDAAYFAQELAALVADKCGSGSIRTRAEWAAYRGRQLTAATRAERVALGAFRLVGYGQRPAPALVTWLVLVALGAVPMMLLLDQDAIGQSGYLEAALGLVVAPFAILRLAVLPDSGVLDGWRPDVAVLIRIVVAVPFAFVLIAGARFLRADWPKP